MIKNMSKNLSNNTLLRPIDVAKLYNISRPTASKWLEDAILGNNSIEIKKVLENYVFLNSKYNKELFNSMKNKGLKYRNKIKYKKVVPSQYFYDTFKENQLIEMITQLEEKSIIANKFAFLGKGTDLWIKYFNSTFFQKEDETYLTEEMDLINISLDHLVLKLKKYEFINLIDINYGSNGYSAKLIVEKLVSQKIPFKYSINYFSETAAVSAKQNFANWFPDLQLEINIEDVESLALREKLFNNKLENSKNVCNLILFLDSNIADSYDRQRVLRKFSNSMGNHDYLILNNGIRSQRDHEDIKLFYSNHYVLDYLKWIPTELGITESDYQFTETYDIPTETRRKNIKLLQDIDILFRFKKGQKVLSLKQGQQITLYSYFSYTISNFLKEIESVGLISTFHACYTDNSYCIILAEIDQSLDSYENHFYL
jgi:hypothetical protein